MKDIFLFDSMLTPKIITFVYWLLLLVVLRHALEMMFGGYGGVSFAKLIDGIAILVGGGVGARICSEILIVIFKIHENIEDISVNRK